MATQIHANWYLIYIYIYIYIIYNVCTQKVKATGWVFLLVKPLEIKYVESNCTFCVEAVEPLSRLWVIQLEGTCQRVYESAFVVDINLLTTTWLDHYWREDVGCACANVV